MRNAVAILMVSQGVPMILMGDEMAHTRYGNNNAYAQDNALNWLDWRQLDARADLFRFFQLSIAFRKAHPSLRRRYHLHGHDRVGSGYSDITFHGVKVERPDWSPPSRTLAFMLSGEHAAMSFGQDIDDRIYVAMNMHSEALEFELPAPSAGDRWHRFVDTSLPAPEDIAEPDSEPVLADQSCVTLSGRSVLVLVSR